MEDVIKTNRQAKQSNLIYLLNPIIRGWANVYKHVVSKKIFGQIDHEIWKKLWNWAKRRHPNKSLTWIKAKYFKTKGNRNWVFCTKEVELIKMDQTPIRRHKKIRKDANPFDIEYEEYFEKRWTDSWKKDSVEASKWIMQCVQLKIRTR